MDGQRKIERCQKWSVTPPHQFGVTKLCSSQASQTNYELDRFIRKVLHRVQRVEYRNENKVVDLGQRLYLFKVHITLEIDINLR